MKNKITTLLGCLLATFMYAQSPTFEWVYQVNHSNIRSAVSNVGTDSNLYEYGAFVTTIDLEPTSGLGSLTSEGSADLYIKKNDENGNLLWAKKIGGVDKDHIGTFTLDSNNNIIITGVFTGILDFDPGPGVENREAVTKSAAFILKLDTNGNFMWVEHIEIDLEEIFDGIRFFNDIVVDSNDNIYVTGNFEGVIDFQPGPGIQELTSDGGSRDMFISKLDGNGNFIWASRIGNSSRDFVGAIAIDKMNNLYLSGSFSGTVDFDPGQGTQTLTAMGIEDVFIIKLDSDGSLLWANNHGGEPGPFSLNLYSIFTDDNLNVYFTGDFDGTIDFDPGVSEENMTATGGQDAYITKLNNNGEFQWAKQFKGGTGETYSLATRMAIDTNNDVYISGIFAGSVDYDPNSGTEILVSDQSLSLFNSDAFVVKLDSSGDFLWAEKIGAKDNDGLQSIMTDPKDNLYIIGLFSETIDFDFSAGVEELTALAEEDQFVLKLSNNILNQNDYKSKSFKIYPNPTLDGKISIDLKSVLETVKITVVDIQGRLLQTNTYNNTSKIALDIGDNNVMSPGAYYVKIETVNGQKTIPILKK